ncbi:B3 domain-containing protein REM10-like [Helianthus annuus]|uniref:B3 domain-containing protein REM10-like n=1 Tax=Helianthus annuus TaxID=4232 RepID=UPI000B8F09AB|nr:B3 domain-containing protein REM10-like [Helianthus annuus]
MDEEEEAQQESEYFKVAIKQMLVENPDSAKLQEIAKVLNSIADYGSWCFNEEVVIDDGLVDSLKIPSNSWFIFHYEEALESFRILYFYQDISLAPCDDFYYKPSGNKDYVSINLSFVHHKMLNTIPSYLVLIKGYGKQNWSVRMEDINNELYITTGWKQIKNDLSITADHLIVFEMIDLQTFHITVFNCATCDLVLPPEVCAIVKEKVVEEIKLSSDTEAVQDIINVNEGGVVVVNEDNQIVPISFRVDGHFAEDLGLNRKMGLKIVDAAGDVWNVQVAIGSSRGQPRYYVQGMRKFVKDKGMALGQAFTLNFVKDMATNFNIFSYEWVDFSHVLSITVDKFWGKAGETSDFSPACKTMYALSRLPVEVVKRANLANNLHSLSVQNMAGVVEVYDVKMELNGGKLRYAMDDWQKFMSDNKLKFGDMLHFTYVTSQQKIVLTDVMLV